MARYCVVYVTAPVEAAKKIAEKIVRSRSAACVNIVPRVSSLYWWKGKVTHDAEALLIIKTTVRRFSKLMAVVRKNHPYQVPEIIALPIIKGNTPYLNWLHAETK